jgi:hypothetical protein
MNIVKIAIMAALLAAQCFAVDHGRLLWAIAAVETGHKPRPGRSGETGAHQMMPAAIRDNGTPQRHLAWLARHLPNPTPYRLALAWNAGLTATIEGRTLPRHHDHAQRVVNVYEAISLDHYAAAGVAGGK